MEGKTQRILYEVTDHIAVITFNRPEQRNAFDAEMTQEMRVVMDRFETEEEAWTGIVTGAGDRAFCAGMDLQSLREWRGSEDPGGQGRFCRFCHLPENEADHCGCERRSLGRRMRNRPVIRPCRRGRVRRLRPA